jgi:3-isopropylmalate/(R)-2-methylmalate dehydratase small subunit
MGEPFRQFSSRIVPLGAENVDTDQVVPARYLKVTDKAGLADALFRDWRFNGAGSSREHAPWALAAWGIRTIISTSFADIFRNNALKNSVLPVAVDAATHARLFELVATDPDAQLTVDLSEEGILLPDGTTIDFTIDPFAKRMLLAGTDEIGYVVAKLPGIRAWEATHPGRVDTRLRGGRRRPPRLRSAGTRPTRGSSSGSPPGTGAARSRPGAAARAAG